MQKSYVFNPDAPKYSCRLCGYGWKGRKHSKPVRCPNCKREHWEYVRVRVSVECSCEKCGYSWVSRVENPVCCPSCKARRVKGSSAPQVDDVSVDYEDV